MPPKPIEEHFCASEGYLQPTLLESQRMNEDIEVIQANFRKIYLDGIPRIIADGTAFLSFVCMITAAEALCGYRFGKAYHCSESR